MEVGLVGRRFVTRLKNLGSTDGIAITEYGLLIALVALALIAVLTVWSVAESGAP